VVRGQVLHQDKGHAGIGVGGHAGKEGFKGRQPPGGRADADNGETGSVALDRFLRLDGRGIGRRI
jgi:hypothetical protein